MSHDFSDQPANASFDAIRRSGEEGNDFWLARDLAPILDYQDWRNFHQVVTRAQTVCFQSGHRVADHFGEVTRMVGIGSGANRQIADVRLSRYACYLVVQNGDPAKPVIAQGQSYFALQSRRQELTDQQSFAALSENEKRLAIRNELATHR